MKHRHRPRMLSCWIRNPLDNYTPKSRQSLGRLAIAMHVPNPNPIGGKMINWHKNPAIEKVR